MHVKNGWRGKMRINMKKSEKAGCGPHRPSMSIITVLSLSQVVPPSLTTSSSSSSSTNSGPKWKHFLFVGHWLVYSSTPCLTVTGLLFVRVRPLAELLF